MASSKMWPAFSFPAGFGERGVEGKIKAARFRPRKQDSVSRPLSRHAGGDDRIRAQRLRNRQCQQHASSIKNAHGPGDLACSKNNATSKTKARACGSAPGRRKSPKARWRRRFTASDEVLERHRHRYEFNMKYRDQMSEKGFDISGTSPDGTLAELIELRDHPYFLGLPVSPRISKQTEQAAPAVQRVYSGCIGASGLIAGCGHHNWSSRAKSRDPQEVTFKVSQRELDYARDDG